MTNPKDPAFPTDGISSAQLGVAPSGGLTKREFFAAMAMQGFCAVTWTKDYDHDEVASWSVEAADALIAALNKEPK